MATFAPNYTARYKVQYRAAYRTHKVTFRYGLSTAPPSPEFVTKVGTFLQALAPTLARDFAVLGAEYIAEGGTVALPAAAPTQPTGLNSEDITPGDSPRFYSFTGKSVTGQPGSVFVFGANLDPGQNSATAASDFRLVLGEYDWIAAVLAVLDTAPSFTAADGSSVMWNRYANVAYNAHYQRKARRG
jgi:hypothetical protein